LASVIQLEIPPRSVYVGVVRLALTSAARLAGMDEGKVEDLRIAVSEACANAVLANEKGEGEAPVRITWRQEADRVVIEVVDSGSSRVPDPEDSLVGGSRYDMSVALLHSLVDDCTFEALEEGGTTTQLVFLL
jgi:serine/threonine-protein kinase RsbW